MTFYHVDSLFKKAILFSNPIFKPSYKDTITNTRLVGKRFFFLILKPFY